jgi:phosphoribosylanthranilate isomerase
MAACPKAVFLAGGLNAANVFEAYETVRRYGLDVCNGVLTDGLLDAVKLGAYVMAIDSLT